MAFQKVILWILIICVTLSPRDNFFNQIYYKGMEIFKNFIKYTSGKTIL